MKIVINEKLPKTLSLVNTKKCKEFKNVKKVIEVPNELIDKVVAVINEIFDRSEEFRKIDGKDKPLTGDENDKYVDVIFPIFPNSFSQAKKTKEEKVGIIEKNTKWSVFWSVTPYKDIFIERIKILNKLNDAGAVFTGDIPNPEFSEYIEDKAMVIDVDKTKLIELRKRLIAYRNNLEKNKKVIGKLSFEYKNSGDGKLKIAGSHEIIFTKTPAAIFNFFYQSKKDNNEFRNYKEFNEFYVKNEHIKNIESDEFNKIIAKINERVCEKTSGLIKELISKKASKGSIANTYKLADIP